VHAAIFPGRTEAIDTGYTGHNDYVSPLQEGTGCGMAQAVYGVVYRGVFCDIGIGLRYIGFRLIIVIIADEVLHGIFGKKLFEFIEELAGQGLIGGYNKGGPLCLGNDVGHGKGLAGTGNTEEYLVLVAFLQGTGEGFNGLRLVAKRVEV
jgi:hypothetical protein